MKSILAIYIVGVAYGQITKNDNAPPKVVFPNNERAGAWQPAKDWVQVPLWPATMPLAKPDSGDRFEATGNGTGLVGKHKWH